MEFFLYKEVYGKKTYTSSPSILNTIRLPVRFWTSLAPPSSTISSVSCRSRKYVPTTKHAGAAGQNSIQLGGKSSTSDWTDSIDVMMFSVRSEITL